MREIAWNFYIGHLSISWYTELLKDEKFFEVEKGNDYKLFRIYKLVFVKFKKYEQEEV